MSAGTTYEAGTTGGAASHTHSIEHTHGVPGVSHNHGTDSMSAAIGSPTGNPDALGFISVNSAGGNSTYSIPGGGGHAASGHPGRSHNTKIVGSTNNTTPKDTTTKSQSTSTSGSTSNLPPYLAVFTWKRIS